MLDVSHARTARTQEIREAHDTPDGVAVEPPLAPLPAEDLGRGRPFFQGAKRYWDLPSHAAHVPGGEPFVRAMLGFYRCLEWHPPSPPHTPGTWAELAIDFESATGLDIQAA